MRQSPNTHSTEYSRVRCYFFFFSPYAVSPHLSFLEQRRHTEVCVWSEDASFGFRSILRIYSPILFDTSHLYINDCSRSINTVASREATVNITRGCRIVWWQESCLYE